MQMDPNQYYSPQTMQNAQPFYQPPMMNPGSPIPMAPSTNQAPQLNQPQMNQQPSVPAYHQPQFQYGNNQNVNYSQVGPPVANLAQYKQPMLQNSAPSQMNSVNPNVQQNYQYNQPDQSAFYTNQNATNPSLPTPNQYGNVNSQVMYNAGQQNVPKVYNPPATNQGNFYSPQPEPQQNQYAATNVLPAQAQQPPTKEIPRCEEPSYVKVRGNRPTNVIGDYKCSDFPTLFTGPFRYATPTQRKPFTMKSDGNHPPTAKMSQMRISRNSRRWELRGGTYFGCFPSRTNGLQDNCPKAKCKSCRTERKK